MKSDVLSHQVDPSRRKAFQFVLLAVTSGALLVSGCLGENSQDEPLGEKTEKTAVSPSRTTSPIRQSSAAAPTKSAKPSIDIDGTLTRTNLTGPPGRSQSGSPRRRGDGDYKPLTYLALMLSKKNNLDSRKRAVVGVWLSKSTHRNELIRPRRLQVQKHFLRIENNGRIVYGTVPAFYSPANVAKHQGNSGVWSLTEGSDHIKWTFRGTRLVKKFRKLPNGSTTPYYEFPETREFKSIRIGLDVLFSDGKEYEKVHGVWAKKPAAK